MKKSPTTARPPASKSKKRAKAAPASGPLALRARDNDELRASLAVFAARVGNELNNPLAAVLAAHRILRRRIESESALTQDARVRSFMDIIDAELASTSRVVDDLLAFGALRPVLRGYFLLREMVDDAIQLVRRPANVTFENRLSAESVPANLDRDMCVRLVSQILKNGVDAIPVNGQGTVVIEGASDRSSVRLVIKDDGVGMKPEVLSRITEPLFSTKAKGTGLGLSIVDALVRAQGGELSCSSAPGAGTTFEISFPNG